MKKYALIMLLLAFGLNVKAQDNETPERPLNFGLYLGGNFNMHSPNLAITHYADALNPNLYPYQDINIPYKNSANGFGLNIGGVINIPINRTNWISLRLGYNNVSADFSENYNQIIDPLTGSVDPNASAVYNLDNSISYIEIAPMYQIYDLIPVKDLYLMAGVEIGIAPSVSHNFNADVTYQGATPPTTHINIPVGNFQPSNNRYALAIGAGYMYDINENFHIAPEISYRFSFSDVMDFVDFNKTNNLDFSWKANQLRVGVNFTYSFSPEKEEIKPESQISADVPGAYYYNNGARVKAEKVTVEDVQISELFPLLTNVFFEEGKAVPATDNQTLAIETETGEFMVENLPANAIEINKSTLDIVGRRMQKFPNARIKLTGTNDNKKEKLDLSKKRAEFAKNYIAVNYGISPDRIDVDAKNLPEKASSTKDPEGVVENRRVEITSNVPAITEPIIIEQDRQTFATPNLLEFEPTVTSTDSITSWTFEINQSGKTLRSFAGTNQPSKIQWNVQPNELKQSDVPIDFTFFAENSAGKTVMKSGSVPVEYYSFNRKKVEERPDKIISKFSLVVFDFDSPEISEKDKEILRKNVIPSINYNSTIQIYGYSDRIGDEEYNQKLALKRAEAVKKFLAPNTKSNTVEVFGIGENIEAYDNNLQIGRQLSRTVQIYVVTPKESK